MFTTNINTPIVTQPCGIYGQVYVRTQHMARPALFVQQPLGSPYKQVFMLHQNLTISGLYFRAVKPFVI